MPGARKTSSSSPWDLRDGIRGGRARLRAARRTAHEDLDEQTIQARRAERGEDRMLEQVAEFEAVESGPDGLSAPDAGTSSAATPRPKR